VAGESAKREYERIRDGRRSRLRRVRTPSLIVIAVVAVGGGIATHALLGVWWLGPLFAAVFALRDLAPTQREIAWRKGAEGEQAVGRKLDRIGPSTRALHDRLIPGSRANIDHILVTPAGVWTIDAKNYTGRLEVRRRGTELWVNGRNRSKLLQQAARQTEVVRLALAAAGFAGTPVRPALCFLGVEWPWFSPNTAGDVRLVSPRGLASLAKGPDVLSAQQVTQVAQALDRHLVAAIAPGRTAPPVPPTTNVGRTSTPVRPSAPPAPGPSDPAAPPAPSTNAVQDLVVREWKRYGKHRMYVNRTDGTSLGYVDLETNKVVAEQPHDVDLITRAVADHLR
jgi:hypothetical protein